MKRYWAGVCGCSNLIHQTRTWTPLKMTDKKYLHSAGFLVVFPIPIIYEPVLHETCLHCGRCDAHIRQCLPFSPAVIPPNIGCQIVVRCLPKVHKNNPVCTDIIFFVKLICSYCVWFGTPLELQYKHCLYLLPVITDLNTNHRIRIPLESQVSCWTASLDAGWRDGGLLLWTVLLAELPQSV